MISKKIAASTVALALGASAIVAPRATALPDTFVSPPTLATNPEQKNCNVSLAINTTSVSPGRVFVQEQSGVVVGAALNAENTQFTSWITLDPEGERIFKSGDVNITVENEAQQTATHSYNLEALSKGNVQFAALNPSEATELNVTDLSPANPESFQLSRGEKRVAHAELGVDPAAAKAQTWGWKLTSPTIRAHERTRVSPEASIDVAPWPIETDDCLPLAPSATETKAIIADGNEYDTGITVANGSKADYARLTGNVSVAGKKIEDAQVRVDDSGKVFVTLPKGATGEVDDNKPVNVDVELLAQPREQTKNSVHDSYSNAQVLRVVNEQGFVTQDSETFTATVPVAKFAPAYNSPNTVKPGASVDVALKTQPGDVRGKAVDATYTVVDAPEGWSAEPAEDGTLKVTAPKGAKHGETAEFTVEVTYADGSKDTITTVVKVQDTDANLNTPGYGETYGKVTTEVTLEQNNKKLPKGSTFTITPGQDLGDWEPKVDPKTGKITVTIPESANPGDVKTILVDVKYPDGTVDTKVPAKVTVLNEPGYGEVTNTPGTEVELPHTGKVVEGSTFTINPKQDLGEWEPKIDEKTGKITVTIPESAKPGDEKTILVDVKDPKSGKTDTVPAKVIVRDTPQTEPGGNTDKTPGNNNTVIIVYPGQDKESTPQVPGGDKKDYTFKIPEGWKIPDGWKIELNPKTGDLTVTPPFDVKPNTTITIPVEVKTPEGKTQNVEVPVKTLEGGIPYVPGQKDPLVVYVPKDSAEKGWKVPEGWTYERKGDNQYIVKVPEGTKPGNYQLVVPGANGEGSVTIQVEVQQPQNLVSDQGSSENLQKCFANMSSEGNPLLWLVPLGLLIAIGAPLAGPIGQELGKAAANVSDKMNIPNPFEQFGLGGEINRRPQPEWIRQIQVEAGRLQQQFGPEVTQAAAIGLSLAGLAAGLGILAALCKDGDLPEWAQSSKGNTEGSSENGSSSNDGEDNAAPAPEEEQGKQEEA